MNDSTRFQRDDARPPGASVDAQHPAAVRLEGVSFGYDRGGRAVEEIDLNVRRGEVHALLGASGSGKSTLLRLIAGLERPDAGRVMLGERVVAGEGRDAPPERRPVGIVFQDYALFPHLSVERNVCFGMKGRPRRERRGRARVLLRRVGLEDRAKSMPHTLSGGQQQRVALARALARDPAVMLLDEPFSGLDAELRDRVRETTLRVLREAGVAVVMVTHDPAEALAAADRVSLIRDGRIDATGDPGEICVRRTDALGNHVIRVREQADLTAADPP